MGTINQQSVREEAERIKTEFDRLSVDKKINSETKMLIRSMFMLINLLIAIFLEKTTKKNNKNSSKPSSQTEKDKSSLTNHGTNSKGKPESNTTADNTRTVESITIAEVTQCDVCGQDLSNIAHQHVERRTKIDIIFQKVIEHIDAHVKLCPDCGSTVKGVFPANMHGPLQYGNGLKAYVINLLICQMISLNRVQKLIKSMIGEILSEATLLKFILRLHLALAQWEADSIKLLLISPAMNVDETSLRVDKKNHWIHVYSAGDVTLKLLHPRRGTEAINDINNGKRGKMAKSDAHNLWERLRDYEYSVLLFAKKSEVSFTNNRAERDLRMSKVKQKVSGCFRKELYAQAYCRISSYLQTMATKGYNPLIAIQMALVGESI
jgi:transposase